MAQHTSALTCPLICWNLNHEKHAKCASLAPRYFTLLLPIHHQTEIHFQTDSKHYFLMHSGWKSFQIVHLFQWPVSLTQTQIGFWLTILHLQVLTQNQLNTANDFDFSLVTLVPNVAEDIYVTTVTEDIDMTDVSPLLCRWSLLMITGRLYFPLPTHLKWTFRISSCLLWARHQLDWSTEQQLQMLRRISTFFSWSHLVPQQDPLRIGMCFSWTCPLMRYLFSTNYS